MGEMKDIEDEIYAILQENNKRLVNAILHNMLDEVIEIVFQNIDPHPTNQKKIKQKIIDEFLNKANNE